MTNVCVGVRSDGTIDLDLASAEEDERDGWNFNNLSVEEGEFLLEELTHAVARAKARRAVLDARKPPPPPETTFVSPDAPR